jgi:galactose mutarotase-like enzyme
VFWGKHSPILFPIVGTLKNNSFSYDNKEYELSRHGFARDNDFIVSEVTDTNATFSFSSSEETLKVYPFQFELKIMYSLEGDLLKVKYVVINKNNHKMPFSIGGHPAFSLPKNFEDYSLEFEKEETLTSYSLQDDLLSDKTETFKLNEKQLLLNYSLFEKDALIFKKLKSKSIRILEDEKPLLKISFNDFPNLGIWTKNKAPFLCIEPWFGYSDTLESSGLIVEKEGIVLLGENKTFEAFFEIKAY